MNQQQRQAPSKLLYLASHQDYRASGVSIDKSNADEADKNIVWQKCVLDIATKRDRQAFQQLYLYFAPRIKSFYLQNSPAPHSEEMTHDVFIKVWQKAATYDPNNAKVSTWLFTIARNVRIDKFRKKKVAIADADITDLQPKIEQNELNEGKDEMLDSLNSDRLGGEIHRLLPKLNLEQRQVLQKVYFEEKSHQIAALELSMTLGTVKSRVRSALKLLRTNMQNTKEEGGSDE